MPLHCCFWPCLTYPSLVQTFLHFSKTLHYQTQPHLASPLLNLTTRRHSIATLIYSFTSLYPSSLFHHSTQPHLAIPLPLDTIPRLSIAFPFWAHLFLHISEQFFTFPSQYPATPHYSITPHYRSTLLLYDTLRIRA